jgi:hypothetical protein
MVAPLGAEARESELVVKLPHNGAVIRLYGADNPDALRGIYLDGVVLDEYADTKPSLWGAVIRPLLADRRGWAVFIGTPKGRNVFYEIVDHARNSADWFDITLKASESGLLHPEELADAQRTMSEDQYNAEFECSFDAAILGAYWGKEMRRLLRMGAFAMSNMILLSLSRRRGTWAARIPPRYGSSSGSGARSVSSTIMRTTAKIQFTTPKSCVQAVQIRRALAAPRCPRKDAGERRQVGHRAAACLGHSRADCT